MPEFHSRSDRIANMIRRFTLSPTVSLPRVSESLPFTFTGADLYALCSDAMLKAVTRSAREVDQRVAAINHERAQKGQSKISVAYYFDHYGSEDDTQVMVEEEDFLRAKEELTPSVSLEELRHYERVRATFEGVTKKAPDGGEGLEDGSSVVAKRSGSGVPNGPGNARYRAIVEPMKRELMKKAAAGSKVNGGGHVSAASRGSATAEADGHPDSDADDFVIRTDALSLGSQADDGKGKGKAKSRETSIADMGSQDGKLINGRSSNGAADGEDLYD